MSDNKARERLLRDLFLTGHDAKRDGRTQERKTVVSAINSLSPPKRKEGQ